MATSRFLRRILIAAAVVAIGGMAIVAAQSASNAGDPLLEEVRALRADVNHAASTGISRSASHRAVAIAGAADQRFVRNSNSWRRRKPKW